MSGHCEEETPSIGCQMDITCGTDSINSCTAQTIIHNSFCNKVQSNLIILNDNILSFIIVARGTLKFD